MNPEPEAGPKPASALSTTIRWGAIAFVGAALFAQLLAWLDRLFIPGMTTDVWMTGKVGALYLSLMHAAPLSASADAATPISVDLVLVPGLGTVAAGVLLYLGGKAVGKRCEATNPMRRGACGLLIAPVYALLVGLVAFAVASAPMGLSVGSVEGGITAEVGTRPLAASIGALVLAAAASFAGAFLSDRASLDRERWSAWLRGALIGGWRGFVALMGLTVVGLLIVTVVRPDEGRLLFAGFDQLDEDWGTAAAIHNVVLLPNETMWIAIPAMGGCDGIRGMDFDSDVICGSVSLDGSGSPQVGTTDTSTVELLVEYLGLAPPDLGTPPLIYVVFPLAVVLAALFGGAGAARRADVGGARDGALVGAGAGVVFGALVGAGAFLSQIRLDAPTMDALFGADAWVRVGPIPLDGMVRAIVIGVLVGALGGAVFWRPWRSARSEA